MTTLFSKKILKNTLAEKQLKQLKNYVIFLPKAGYKPKKNIFRTNKTSFINLHTKRFTEQTLPANSLIAPLEIYNTLDSKTIMPVLFIYKETYYLLPSTQGLLNVNLTYQTIASTLHFYKKFFLLLKMSSVKI